MVPAPWTERSNFEPYDRGDVARSGVKGRQPMPCLNTSHPFRREKCLGTLCAYATVNDGVICNPRDICLARPD